MTIYDYDFCEEYELDEEELDEELLFENEELREARDYQNYMDICKGCFDL